MFNVTFGSRYFCDCAGVGMSVKTYHLIPFSIQPLRGKDVDSVLAAGCNVLETVGSKYWLSAGTLLGMYRDGDHIPHDTDIDVGVLYDSNNSFMIPTAMEMAGFNHIRTALDDNGFMQFAFMHPKENVIFDIFFFHDSGEGQVLFNNSEHGTMTKPASFIEDMDTLRGYPVPTPVEAYLEMRYGHDWRIPKKSKDSWDKDCKNFTRSDT